jgi:hypothetical protein
MPRQIERTVQGLRKWVSALAIRAQQASMFDDTGTVPRSPDLIIVDEAERLNMAGLSNGPRLCPDPR